MEHFPILSLITFLPVIGMILIMFIPKAQEKAIKNLTLGITGIQLLLSIIILAAFDYTKGGVFDASSFQFIEKFRWIDIAGMSWIGRIKIDYFLGVDGISVPLIFLTALITFIATLASWNISKSVKGYFALFLLLDTGMVGVFVSLDFFLFYIFWELMLLPMYFLIGIWGGPRREYAAIKFFLYTLLGSVFILLAIIGLYFSSMETLADGTRVFTFNMLELMNTHNYLSTGILSPLNPNNLRLYAFLALFIGFAIKIPMFPFHTWLPDAHVEAPTAISVILAGVLLKMGTYGILRICYPMFPEITKDLAWYIALVWNDKYYLWGAVRDGAKGFQEADCLLFGFTHGFCITRYGSPKYHGYFRCSAANVQPRYNNSNALYYCRSYLRPCSYQGY